MKAQWESKSSGVGCVGGLVGSFGQEKKKLTENNDCISAEMRKAKVFGIIKLRVCRE